MFKTYRHGALLVAMIGIYIGVLSLITQVLYHSFSLYGIDLAIFNQVLWNSIHGRLLQFTITNNFYFGDHFEPILFLLMPMYTLFQRPETLLVMQTIFIAAGAIPIYLVAKQKLGKNFGILFAFFYLLFPQTISVNLFDFHTISLAIFFLGFTYYFFEKKQFGPFLIFFFFSLLIQEEVSLILFMFGLLAWFQKRDLKWILVPLIGSSIWFFGAINLISYFNRGSSGQYKYLTYYSYLGNSVQEILTNILLHPIQTAAKFFTIDRTFSNILFCILLLFPLGFLAVFRADILLLALPFFLQSFLLDKGAFPEVLLHRVSLAIPFVFFATIGGFAKAQKFRFAKENRIFCFSIFLVLFLVSSIFLSQLGYIPSKIAAARSDLSRPYKDKLISEIPPDASVLTNNALLPKLSSRQYLYDVGSVATNAHELQKQNSGFSFEKTPEYVLIDAKVLSVFNNGQDTLSKEKNENLLRFFQKNDLDVVDFADTFLLFKKGTVGQQQKLVEKASQQTCVQNPRHLGAQISICAFSLGTMTKYGEYAKIPLSLSLKNDQKQSDELSLVVNIRDGDSNRSMQKILPLGYKIYPTQQWQKGETITQHINLLVPAKFNTSHATISVQLVKLTYDLSFDFQHFFEPTIATRDILGPEIVLR